MAILWFGCFVVAFLVAVSKGTEAKTLESQIEECNKRLKDAQNEAAKAEELKQRALQRETEAKQGSELAERHAESKLTQAKETLSEAHLIKSEALKTKETIGARNQVLNEAVEEIVNLWVNDSWKAISEKLTVNNHATQKSRMERVFETCRKLGIQFDGRQENAFYVRLETEWRREIESEKAREEQRRIKEIMREEQQAQKARSSELKKLEDERKNLEIQKRTQLERIGLLTKMESLQRLSEEQQRELEIAKRLNQELETEIAERERRKSMAELTKAGNVYVISNIGSFGERVFKIGMTRRLIPEDRIKELGDASVPFPFDCHMMIPAEDAPALESRLHEALWTQRINLVNERKEFFRADLNEIKQIVDRLCKDTKYTYIPAPQATDWRESESRRKQGDFGSYTSEYELADETESAA